LQQAVKQDTKELSEIMLNVPVIKTNDQHQLFGPLVNSSIN